VAESLPDAQFHERARCITLEAAPAPRGRGTIVIAAAGTADLPVAEEAVVAVPTSVGYGASFGGLTALLAMLNSCATGVSVVNIDNGFGAAAIASSINHL